MTGHVRGSGSLTSGPRCSAGRTFIRAAGGGVGSDPGGAGLAHSYLSSCPGACRLDSFPRSLVLRVLLLIVREHVLGAVGGSQRQRPVVLPVHPRLQSLADVPSVEYQMDFPSALSQPSV